MFSGSLLELLLGHPSKVDCREWVGPLSVKKSICQIILMERVLLEFKFPLEGRSSKWVEFAKLWHHTNSESKIACSHHPTCRPSSKSQRGPRHRPEDYQQHSQFEASTCQVARQSCCQTGACSASRRRIRRGEGWGARCAWKSPIPAKKHNHIPKIFSNLRQIKARGVFQGVFNKLIEFEAKNAMIRRGQLRISLCLFEFCSTVIPKSPFLIAICPTRLGFVRFLFGFQYLFKLHSPKQPHRLAGRP